MPPPPPLWPSLRSSWRTQRRLYSSALRGCMETQSVGSFQRYSSNHEDPSGTAGHAPSYGDVCRHIVYIDFE